MSSRPPKIDHKGGGEAPPLKPNNSPPLCALSSGGIQSGCEDMGSAERAGEKRQRAGSDVRSEILWAEESHFDMAASTYAYAEGNDLSPSFTPADSMQLARDIASMVAGGSRANRNHQGQAQYWTFPSASAGDGPAFNANAHPYEQQGPHFQHQGNQPLQQGQQPYMFVQHGQHVVRPQHLPVLHSHDLPHLYPAGPDTVPRYYHDQLVGHPNQEQTHRYKRQCVHVNVNIHVSTAARGEEIIIRPKVQQPISTVYTKIQQRTAHISQTAPDASGSQADFRAQVAASQPGRGARPAHWMRVSHNAGAADAYDGDKVHVSVSPSAHVTYPSTHDFRTQQPLKELQQQQHIPLEAAPARADPYSIGRKRVPVAAQQKI